jgi:hypothetical protein
MPAKKRIYEISLCYEAYFGKTIEVEADNLLEACHFAMAHADDDSKWKDTLDSSTHWIDCVNCGAEVVPEEFSAAAIRCGGAVLIAYRLREALRSLIEACGRDASTLTAIGSDIARAKAVLMKVPDRIGD